MSFRTSIIFCDDIRTENNGKIILIGVYGDGLIPADLPQTFIFCIHMRIWDLPVGRHKLAFALAVDGRGDESKQVEIDVPNSNSLIQLNLLGLPAHITKPSNITFTVTGLPEGQEISEVLKVSGVPLSGSMVPPLLDSHS